MKSYFVKYKYPPPFYLCRFLHKYDTKVAFVPNYDISPKMLFWDIHSDSFQWDKIFSPDID